MTTTPHQAPLVTPPDLSGAQGYSWGGMRVPKSIWDAVRAASAGTSVQVPGVPGSNRGPVPPALLLALTAHENASYFTANPDPANHIPDSDPATAYNGVYDVWGPLQLATFGIGHGYTRDQLSDPATNYAIGAKAIESNAIRILATNPTITDSDLWARAIGGDNWSDVQKATPWQAAPYVVPMFNQYPTLTGAAATDKTLPLIPPTTVPGGSAAGAGPFQGIVDAFNTAWQTTLQDLQLWGLKLAVGLAGLAFIALGLWQLPPVQAAAKAVTKDLTAGLL